jgi:uncharacterized protein YodC (DUF2158 family)
MTLEKSPSRVFNEYEDFNVGDVVRLKSGGPNMTVDNASGSRIICIWFESDGIHFHQQSFGQGALEKVAPAEKSEAS